MALAGWSINRISLMFYSFPRVAEGITKISLVCKVRRDSMHEPVFVNAHFWRCGSCVVYNKSTLGGCIGFRPSNYSTNRNASLPEASILPIAEPASHARKYGTAARRNIQKVG